jgi:hypothetical protein
MTFVIAASVTVWFGSSEALRWCGISAMWLRYPLALAVTYGLFLVLLSLLAMRTARRLDSRRDVLRRQSLRHQWHSDEEDELKKFNDFLDDVGDGFRQSNEAGKCCTALPAFLTLMLSATVILICIYFVWLAPVIFAELIVEGSLAMWLYRPNARGTSTNWFHISLEQTGLPAFLMAACLVTVGIGFQIYAPEAETIVDVFQHAARQHEIANAPVKPIFGRR